MPSIRGLILLAFAAAIGVTFLILACSAKPDLYNWYPMVVLTFYVLSPIPTVIYKRLHASDGGWGSGGTASWVADLMVFITTALVASAFCLPLVLADNAVILWEQAGFVLAGNVVVFVCILAYFIFFTSEEDFSFSNRW